MKLKIERPNWPNPAQGYAHVGMWLNNWFDEHVEKPVDRHNKMLSEGVEVFSYDRTGGHTNWTQDRHVKSDLTALLINARHLECRHEPTPHLLRDPKCRHCGAELEWKAIK